MLVGPLFFIFMVYRGVFLCLVVTFPEPVRPGAQNAPQSTNHYSSPSSWIVATKDVLKRPDKDLEMLLNDFMIKF